MLRLAGVHLLLRVLVRSTNITLINKLSLEMLRLHMIPHISFPNVFKLEANATNEAGLARLILKEMWKGILEKIRRVFNTWNNILIERHISKGELY